MPSGSAIISNVFGRASFDIILAGFGRRIITWDQHAATWRLSVDDVDLSAHYQSLDASLIPWKKASFYYLMMLCDTADLEQLNILINILHQPPLTLTYNLGDILTTS